MKTVAYYRNSISKEKQKLSIEMQKDHVRQLARTKNLLIDDEYCDDETSARKTKLDERRQMTRLMDDIKKGKIKKLIVYSRCRLARNVPQYMEIYRVLKGYEIEVLFAAEYEFPMLFTIEGELIERIMAAFNQHEAENLVKKLIDSKRTKARQGLHAVAQINFGYEPNPEKDGDWKIVQAEANDVFDIYTLFKEENVENVNQLVSLVNAKGYKYKEGKEWTYGKLRTLLKSPIYKGIRKYKDKEEDLAIPVPHLQIVPTDLWEITQTKLEVNEREPVREEEEIFYLLQGLIKCADCKHFLKTRKAQRKGQKIGIYQCGNHPKIKFDQEALDKEIMSRANNFFNEILSPVFRNFLKKTFETELKNYESIENSLENFNTRLKEKIGNQINVLIDVNDVSELPEDIKDILEELEVTTRSQERYKDKLFETGETLKALEEFHSEFINTSLILQPEMEMEVIKELLLDIIFEITAFSEKEVNIVMKHPHFAALGGQEVIEFK